MITNLGKTAILNYFGGQAAHIADYIAVGTGMTMPTANDTALATEVVRMPVTSIAADLANARIVFKAQLLPGRLDGNITEVGLYNNGDLSSAALVARTVLDVPKMPSMAVPTEIEYSLQLGIAQSDSGMALMAAMGDAMYQQPGWSLVIKDGDGTGQSGPISVTFTAGTPPVPTDMGQVWLSNTDPTMTAGFPNITTGAPFAVPPAVGAKYQGAFELDAQPGNTYTFTPNISDYPFRYVIFLTTTMGSSAYVIREVWDYQMSMGGM
jgi:hypothetical protein